MHKENLKRGIKPEHPGIVLRELYVDQFNLTNEDLAERLRVTRVTINKLLNGKQSITADMALRVSKAFKTTPTIWLNLQRNFDLWEAEEKFNVEIKAIA